MLINCEWLPPLVLRDSSMSDDDYLSILYRIFGDDFMNSHPIFDGLPVKIRFEPYVDSRVQAFYHVTTLDDGGDRRTLDEFRCERIRWIRAFIEHATCKNPLCAECSGMKLWTEQYHHSIRIKIMLSEERYLVVLEKRKNYILLITAFYVNYDHSFQKLIKAYEKAKGASIETPSETPSTLQ